MDVACSSEMSVNFQQTILSCILEDGSVIILPEFFRGFLQSFKLNTGIDNDKDICTLCNIFVILCQKYLWGYITSWLGNLKEERFFCKKEDHGHVDFPPNFLLIIKFSKFPIMMQKSASMSDDDRPSEMFETQHSVPNSLVMSQSLLWLGISEDSLNISEITCILNILVIMYKTFLNKWDLKEFKPNLYSFMLSSVNICFYLLR